MRPGAARFALGSGLAALFAPPQFVLDGFANEGGKLVENRSPIALQHEFRTDSLRSRRSNWTALDVVCGL
jgi:hypothetical protein